MTNIPLRSFGLCVRSSALAFLLALTPARAVIDLNSDSIGDIFALKYNTGSIAAGVDSDGDGKTNGEESAAGTNPLDSKSTLVVSAVTIDGEGVHVTWPTLLGKRYQVQSTLSLSPVDWQPDGSAVEGTGESVERVFPSAATAKYYRVLVQDKDTDNDGVTDWEEITAGYNPNSAQSFAGTGGSDLTAITAALQSSGNVVTVAATDAEGSEPSSGAAFDTGTFVVTRSGNFNPLTVNYSVAGSAVAGGDYVTLSGSVTLPMFVNSATITVAPLADAALESPESVIVTVTAGAGYTPGTTSATVLINDFASANGNGVLARYWNNNSATTPTFSNTVATSVPVGPTPALTRIDTQINNPFGANSPSTPGTQVNADYFVGRYTADLLPEFSQIYTFTAVVDRGCRLWVNGTLVLTDWPAAVGGDPGAGTSTGTIELEANKRVPIVFEYMARSGTANNSLQWASANRPIELIPQSRLFATAPPQILSSLEVLLIKNSPLYTYQILASGEPTSYGAANLPPGWTINTATGVISGTPTTAGTWLIPVRANNANGSGTAILNLQVIATGSAITRDVWTGVPGTTVAAIPLSTPPTSTATITSLNVPQSAPDQDDYGTRIRGYITAPKTGVYKFWLTGSDSAELQISDDDEVVNSFKRAAVTSPTGYQQWTSVNAGKSPLLQLFAGRRYFIEVRQKAGVGASDHVSVGWLKPGDPGSADPASVTAPTEVVPSYVLSPYVAPGIVPGENTLFTTALVPETGVVTNGFGSASLRLSADETQAIIFYSYSNLSGAATTRKIRSAANGDAEIFNLGAASVNPDGSYTWNITPNGGLTTSQIVDAIKGGSAYLSIATASNAGGEIRGNFRLQVASQTFTPPAAQTWSDPESAGNVESHLNPNGASRFLVQATFGTSPADLASGNLNSVSSLGYEGWIDYQATLPPTLLFPVIYANRNQTDPQNSTYTGNLLFNGWWKNAVTAPDQLRQRVAFALSEILVTSEDGPLDERAEALSSYYDVLLNNAFGNFRNLLEAVTLHPAMGRYLDMLRNDKPDKTTGRIPNENYAREIKQLFSIGLDRLHPDGSLMLNSKGELIPTYNQDAIIGFSHVFTGWDYNYTGGFRTSFGAGTNWIDPMREVPVRHFTGQKLLLNNVVLPGLTSAGGSALDPYATHSSTQYNDPAYQALPAQELAIAHDVLFNHPNCGPFICRQLIQRLVTSTPSRGYLYRVVSAFNDNGSGVRGDMKAVIKAILLDYEARSAISAGQQGFGKQREPVVRITGIARAFPSPSAITGTYTQTGSLITINTPTNHLYASGSSVPLEFSEATAGTPGSPHSATYTIAGVTAQSFTVRVKSFEGPVTYEQNGAATRFTVGGNGFYPGVGETIHVEYLDGNPAPPASGTDVVDYRSSDEFNIHLGVPGAKRATYSQAAGSSNLVVTSNAHGYLVGASLQINFVSGTGVSGLYSITAVTSNTFTVTAADTLARSGSAIVVDSTLALPLVTGTANVTRITPGGEFADRSGTVAVTYSDWNMDSTNTDLNQTPMRSPTVFNFFLPDYQFPGILGNAGLITPEFELTSETSVIRQANFIYSGLYNTALSQTGLESFKGGGRDIIVDLRPWMGAGPGGLPWLHDNNLNALFDQLNTLLTGGQLPAAAKTLIRNHVATLPYGSVIGSLSAVSANPVVVTLNSHGLATGDVVTIAGVTGSNFSPSINGTHTVTVTGTNTFTIPVIRSSGGNSLSLTNSSVSPIPSRMRDRIRAIVHLIVTSPDFTIQK